MNKNKVKEFLRESNAIEGVHDTHSLKMAQKAWGYLISQNKLNDLVVKKTHYLLMKDLLPSNKIGYYRQEPVFIGGEEAPNFTVIPEVMAQWADVVNANVQAKIPSWKMQHVTYEKIHPFIDGNGRTGRMFMNWQRVKIGLSILVIKEAEKQKYYKWFE